MPELPEVETIARQLADLVTGRTIAAFASDWERITEPEPVPLVAARLAGRRIQVVRRRGKLVVFELDGGDALCTSLRMTGRFAFKALGEAASEPFTRATFTFTDGTALDFVDMRKLGRMVLVDIADLAPVTAGGDRTMKAPLHFAMGREPLGRSFTDAWLRTFLRRRRRAAIKPLLLDQRGIAGIGNIYASEALWRARIHPLRAAGTLKPDEVARLHEAIKWVLRKAIRLHGSTLRTYRDSSGKQGGMQHEFVVYDRAGAPCDRCGGLIRRTVLGGRSTYHCPRCQRAPRAKVAR
ncbi:MAG: bifunctional DNA-formamidopyrimidine glycosylase/DNA-(apurinic or apyrimidinic site) lyase [Chloroflexota bacterium]|nr:bifunctional DNA-formamidopyrimidine glycosylase/DNA-(apurinic or apyrimidinic site) lyase [Chloroflexota bacterium]